MSDTKTEFLVGAAAIVVMIAALWIAFNAIDIYLQ